MSHPPDPVPIETLLRYRGWLRSMIRELAADPHLAEDVEQATWATAVARPPRDKRGLGAWLVLVARSRLTDTYRREQRRLRREAVAARPEALPSTEDLVGRAELQQRVAAVVLALEEPYRTVVLQHYFDGRSLAAIADAMDLPLETVRTRLKRAKAKLRTRLDRAHGGQRGRWVVAGLALSRGPAPGATAPIASRAATGAIMMATKKLTFAGILALLLVAVGLVWWGTSSRDADPAAPVTLNPGAQQTGMLDDPQAATGPTLSGPSSEAGEAPLSAPVALPPQPEAGSVSWTIALTFSPPVVHGVAEIGLLDAGGKARQLSANMEIPAGNSLLLHGESANEAELPTQLVVALRGRVGTAVGVSWSPAEAGARRGRATLTWPAGETFEGAIADPEGVPVAGFRGMASFDRTARANYADATTRIRGLASLGRRYAEFVTDAAGRFKLLGVPVGSHMTVSELDPDWKVFRPEVAHMFGLPARGATSPDDVQPFVAVRVLLAMVNILARGAPAGSPRPPGTVVSVAEHPPFPRGTWQAQMPFRWDFRRKLPPSGRIVSIVWAAQGAFAELLGKMHSSVRVRAPGYEEASGHASYWVPGAPIPTPLKLYPLRPGQAQPLRLRLVPDQQGRLPPEATIALLVEHEDAPDEGRAVSFQVTSPSTLQSIRPLPAGRYTISCSLWLAESVVAAPAHEARIRLVPAGRIRGVELRAAFPPGMNWSDVGLNLEWGTPALKAAVGTTSRCLSGSAPGPILHDEVQNGQVLRYYFNVPEAEATFDLKVTAHGPGYSASIRIIPLRPGQIKTVDFSPWPSASR